MKPVAWDAAALVEYDDALALSSTPMAFRNVVRSVLATMSANPAFAPRVNRAGAREYILPHRLPYSIVYLDEQTEIRVIAFSHHKRKRGYWKNRLPRP